MAATLKDNRTSITTLRDQFQSFATVLTTLVSHWLLHIEFTQVNIPTACTIKYLQTAESFNVNDIETKRMVVSILAFFYYQREMNLAYSKLFKDRSEANSAYLRT